MQVAARLINETSLNVCRGMFVAPWHSFSAEQGARVAGCDLNDAGGKETLAVVEAEGAEGFHMHADVSKEEDIKAFVDATAETFDRMYALNLREHGVEIPDSEIQHEGTIGREIVAVLRERRKHRDAFLLDPSRRVRTRGREVDAEMGLVLAR